MGQAWQCDVISYEEYHPYGTTAWQADKSGLTARAKRYRYTQKERDAWTGLSYHGARYYAPWLGRWESADPAGMVDGPNRYQYVRGSPASGLDPSGRVEVRADMKHDPAFDSAPIVTYGPRVPEPVAERTPWGEPGGSLFESLGSGNFLNDLKAQQRAAFIQSRQASPSSPYNHSGEAPTRGERDRVLLTAGENELPASLEGRVLAGARVGGEGGVPTATGDPIQVGVAAGMVVASPGRKFFGAAATRDSELAKEAAGEAAAEYGVAKAGGAVLKAAGPLVGRLASEGVDNSSILLRSGRDARKALRGALGLGRGSGTEAHHIIPLGVRDHEVVQLAARGGFDFDGAANGVALTFEQHRGLNVYHHNKYNAAVRMKLDFELSKNPDMTPQQAADFLHNYAATMGESIRRTGSQLQ